MGSNPIRKWWVALAIAHIVFGVATSVSTIIETNSLTNVAPIVMPFTYAGLIGLVVMSAGLRVQRTRLVGGSWLVLIGLVPTIISITGIAVLLSGFWTANIALREKAIATGYDDLSVRNRAIMARSWWVWVVAGAAMFGLGWLGLVLDNWLLWILPWVSAALLGFVGLAMGVAVYVDRHRTREA